MPHSHLAVSSICLVLTSLTPALAAAPNLQTPPPVIYLSDNLGEKDNLGFCIDTVGRGMSDRLHAHSCKPQGGDVQFRYDPVTGHIISAAFDNMCAQLLDEPAPGVKLGLQPCSDDPLQSFAYEPASEAIHPFEIKYLCLGSPGDTYAAGPYESRALELVNCDATPPAERRWSVEDQ
ncbi:RICIN domain-containing protein [Roseibium sp. RKSG952]|uniref:RICIN domain-containing protein n=1 Tax=Roseibium sp. RKSG952 TaxID=2529384 RepID=UPI0012BD4886|nr:RICIN domain-containing protein [Roseibium sp. RKSG952]MTH97676.1 hypothetical protein [Roseibium sp. RKSG952]